MLLDFIRWLRRSIAQKDNKFLGGMLHAVVWWIGLKWYSYKVLRIDHSTLEASIPKDFGDDMRKRIKKHLKPNDNVEFFGNSRKGLNRHHPLGFEGDQFELFPPNIAVLDFLLKNIRDPNTVILDYGCGMGTLIVYLKKLGFNKVYGYDNNTQLDKSTAEDFLASYDINKEILLSAEKIASIQS